MHLKEISQNPAYSVSFSYQQQSTELELDFTVRGEVPKLYSLPLAKPDLRLGRDLWQHTCFECFFFSTGTDFYTELNFNPQGEYAFLFFDTYRQRSAKTLHFEVRRMTHQSYAQELQIKAHLELPGEQFFRCAPAVILMPTGQSPLYFAIEHPSKADFHHRQTVESKGFQVLT